MNFNSEGRWGEKRQALAQQGEGVLWEETVETQAALYEATSSRCPCCCSGWMFLDTRPGCFHLTEGNVLTSSDSHCHQAALLTAPSFRALLICCAACSIPSSAERIPEVKRFPGWELLLLETLPSRPNSPQRKTLTHLMYS